MFVSNDKKFVEYNLHDADIPRAHLVLDAEEVVEVA